MRATHKAGIAIVLLLGGTAALWAQVKTEDATGSLAALTSEVRQLRVAVEEAGRIQGQTQALSVYISAQQSRMVQLAARLEAMRAEIAVGETTANMTASLYASARSDATQSQDPKERQDAAEMLPTFKQHADAAADALQNLRNRQAEMQQAMQVEEQRWSDLISRLEQSIKK